VGRDEIPGAGVGATVLSLGMTYTTAQLIAPLKRVWLVIVVVVNAVAIPAIAWLVAESHPISDAYVSGLVLATLGAGSAAALKGAQLAKRADLPLAVSPSTSRWACYWEPSSEVVTPARTPPPPCCQVCGSVRWA